MCTLDYQCQTDRVVIQCWLRGHKQNVYIRLSVPDRSCSETVLVARTQTKCVH